MLTVYVYAHTLAALAEQSDKISRRDLFKEWTHAQRNEAPDIKPVAP